MLAEEGRLLLSAAVSAAVNRTLLGSLPGSSFIARPEVPATTPHNFCERRAHHAKH